MGPILKLKRSTASIVATLAGMSLVAGCGSGDPLQPVQGSDEEPALELRRVGDMPYQPEEPRKKDLSVNECFKLKGTVLHSELCPKTTSDLPGGGRLVGKLSCKLADTNTCIEVNTTAP